MRHPFRCRVLALALVVFLPACAEEEGEETGGEISEIDVEEPSREEAQSEQPAEVVRYLRTADRIVYDPPTELALPAPGAATRPGPQSQIQQGTDTSSVPAATPPARQPLPGPQTAPDTARSGASGQRPDTTRS